MQWGTGDSSQRVKQPGCEADHSPPTNTEVRPEPACGISIGVCKKAVSDWTNRNHTTGLRQAKGLIPGPSARRTKYLLKLNRDQLRWVIGLFTGHRYLKGHLFKLGLTDRWPHLRKVPGRRWISRTYPMLLWGCSLLKISSPGPVLHGTKWLLWHPHK
jgi:hypothetical protein